MFDVDTDLFLLLITKAAAELKPFDQIIVEKPNFYVQESMGWKEVIQVNMRPRSKMKDLRFNNKNGGLKNFAYSKGCLLHPSEEIPELNELNKKLKIYLI